MDLTIGHYVCGGFLLAMFLAWLWLHKKHEEQESTPNE